MSTDERFKIVEFSRYDEIVMEHKTWVVWKLCYFKGSEKASWCWQGDRHSRKSAAQLCELRRLADKHWSEE